MPGLTMKFVTDDGKFAEELDAIALFPVVSDAPQFPQVLAASERDALLGTWEPFDGYDGTTVTFFSRLGGDKTAEQGGNVSLNNQVPAEVMAGVVHSGLAVVTWPVQ